MELGQLPEHPDHTQNSDYRDATHYRKTTYNLKDLERKGITYPLSASGRNWNGTETIWQSTLTSQIGTC